MISYFFFWKMTSWVGHGTAWDWKKHWLVTATFQGLEHNDKKGVPEMGVLPKVDGL